MSTKTNNYNLIKPGEDEFIDIKDINKNMDTIDAKMKDVENKVGAPMIATTAAEMTNKERPYVYVGSQSGYTKGNWYYWNGSSWVSGGVYNSVAVETDKTLTVAGKAADGEVVGQEIGSLKESISNEQRIREYSILSEKERAVTRENEIEKLFTTPTQEAVNNWLTEHPEATTTVQDNSLGIDKIVIGALGYITPKMFGAVGDGKHDDSEAFVKAIEKIKTLKIKILYVPSGEYIFSKPITLPSDIMLIGDGKNTKFTITSDYSYNKLIGNELNATDIFISSIYINLNEKSFSDKGNVTRGIIALEQANRIVIQNTIIENKYTSVQITENQPIWIDGCSYVDINNCALIHKGVAQSGKGGGIWIFSKNRESKKISIKNCNFDVFGDENIALFTNTYAYKITDVFIENNIFLNDNVTYGITLIADNSSIGIENVKIFQNKFENAKINMDYNINNVTISDNLFNFINLSKSNIISTTNNTDYKKDHKLKIVNNIFSAKCSGLCLLLQSCFLKAEIVDNLFVTEASEDKNCINIQGNDSKVERNTIVGFDIAISLNNVIFKNNTIKECEIGVQTMSSGFVIDNNIFKNCDRPIEIISNVLKDSFAGILNNVFILCKSIPILVKTKMTQAYAIVSNNTDYNGTDSVRNFVEIEENGSSRLGLFNNHKYRTEGYLWSVSDS